MLLKDWRKLPILTEASHQDKNIFWIHVTSGEAEIIQLLFITQGIVTGSLDADNGDVNRSTYTTRRDNTHE